MGLQDLFITPIFLILIFAVAFSVRETVTNKHTKQFFIPALGAKLFGAIALGAVYQFYYGGGDTFTYFDQGSKHIHDAFMDNPKIALELIFSPRKYPEIPNYYASRIWIYKSETEFFVARVAGFFDIFTFHTYSATACLFAVFSFTGSWAMYTTMTDVYPRLAKKLAIAILFFPSIIFWGSGILKDTLTFGSLCWIFYATINLVHFRKSVISSVLILLVTSFIIYQVKIYILLCYIPCTIFWVAIKNLASIKNKALRTIFAPFLLSAGLIGSIFGAIQVGANSNKYSIENIQKTAESTAWWISYSGDQQDGSTYSLGDLDYSITGIIKKSIPAIWVALFRPHPWEVRNPLMLLSAVENLYLLYLCFLVYKASRGAKGIKKVFKEHTILYLTSIFALVFAFAVGLTTYNFGSLARYKLPLLPFFISTLFIIPHVIEQDELLNRIKLFKQKIRLKKHQN